MRKKEKLLHFSWTLMFYDAFLTKPIRRKKYVISRNHKMKSIAKGGHTSYVLLFFIGTGNQFVQNSGNKQG